MERKIYITGVGGLLGYKLSIQSIEKFKVFGSYNLRKPKLKDITVNKLDLTNFLETKEIIKEINPDIIVNTAAISSVDYCEKHRNECEKINVEHVKNLYEISQKHKIKLIQISSDSVFDGNKNMPYVESNEPNPINVYGKTKLESEKIVLEDPNNLVVRSSVLYGWMPKYLTEIESSSKKSINFGQWLVNQLMKKQNVSIVNDEISSPIIAEELARSIIHLIESNCSGIFHCAPNESINRYDFSIKLANILNLDSSLIKSTTISKLGRQVNTGINKALDPTKIINTNFVCQSINESLKMIKNQIDNEGNNLENV